MQNKQRKDKLATRAWKYAEHRTLLTPREAAAYGFQHGYRAAMSDARKAIGHSTLKAPLSIGRQTAIAIRVERFLRPLR